MPAAVTPDPVEAVEVPAVVGPKSTPKPSKRAEPRPPRKAHAESGAAPTTKPAPPLPAETAAGTAPGSDDDHLLFHAGELKAANKQ